MRVLCTVAVLAAALSTSALLHEDPHSFSIPKVDFIVVGGGTAGAVVANRLSEDPNVTVLVLEAGGTGAGSIEIEVPRLAPLLTPGTAFDWNYTTTPQPGIGNKVLTYARGKVLGGCSAINFLIVNKGSKDDFDSYARISGDDSWSWDAMQPYMNKFERLVPPSDSHNTTGQYNPQAHGYSGMVSVSLAGYPTRLDSRVMAAAAEFPDEFPFQPDQNAGNPIGVGWSFGSVGHGQRDYAATSYLGPVYLARKNLIVVTHAVVTRILKTGTRDGLPHFSGVEFTTNATAPRIHVTAHKEVILSAGAINTPKLLMLSGIGDKSILDENKIKTIVHLPGIGKNMSDHPLLVNTWKANSNDSTNLSDELHQWNASRTGRLTDTVTNQIAWLRLPQSDDIFEKFADPSAGPTSAHYEVIFSDGYYAPVGVTPPSGSYFTIFTVLVQPVARGSVSIQSSDPFVDPLIDPSILTNQFDSHTMMSAVRSAERLLSAKAWKGFVVGRYPDEFASARSDKQLEAYVRNNTVSILHPIGTASMSPYGASWGVVDPDLKVKRVSGLRIVDGSVIPYVPSGHPMGIIYAFAERASHVIKDAHDLLN